MSSTTNSTFDPYTQTIVILMADGVTQVTASLADIDAGAWYNVSASINFGTQMGACVIMFFVVLVLTKQNKRRTAIFILNILSLFFGFLRALLFAVYFPSPWTKIYPQVTNDTTFIPKSTYVTSVTASVMPIFMTITVNLSLLLQAHTVCQNLDDIYRWIVNGMSCLVVLLAVGFRFAVTIVNSETIIRGTLFYSKLWISMGALVTETISIWFFSIVFTAKLLFTLYTRRRHGWKQWSGVKILAAMGGCTMIIPSVFAVLEYVAWAEFPEAGSLAMTAVALLLPLSSLWASMAIDQEASTLNFSHLAGYNSDGKGSERSDSTAPSSRFESSNERKGSLAPICNPTTVDSRIEHVASRDSTEVDLQAMGVRVNKSYTIQSRKESV